MEEARETRKPLTVADVDPYIDYYRVAVQERYGLVEIGSKWGHGNYQKAEWYGQRRIPWEQRKYKKNPPWLDREIVEISRKDGMTIIVKEKKK